MVLPNSLIDQAVEMYRSGQTFKQVGAALGKDPESLRIAIKRRGIELPRHARKSSRRLPVPDDLAGRHAAGESVLSLATSYGVARNVVTRWLSEQGAEIRSPREANQIRMDRLGESERQELTAAAHEAVRGRERSEGERLLAAQTRERKAREGTLRRSPMEVQFGEWMRDGGLDFHPEQIVHRYNVDFGCEPVAVELLGGSWHAQPSRRAHHAERTHNILNAGWHMVYVWSTHNVPLTAAGADKVIAHVQIARQNPSPVGKYWVFRGDGELMSSGGDEGDHFTLVVPSIAGLGIRTRH